MGSWDCYCMLCCGPLKAGCVKVGDSDPKALRKRDRRARQEERARKGLDGAPGGDEMESSDEDELGARDDMDTSILPKLPLDSHQQNELYHGNPTRDMYDYYEEYSYDPRFLTRKDVAWIEQCRTLGFNEGTNRAFVSGPGNYYDWNIFETREAGIDPNDLLPESGGNYPCYMANDGDIEDPTFPFHEACFSILAKRLELDDPAKINKEILYKVVRRLGEGNGACLLVDYGGEFTEQFWENRHGEEASSSTGSPTFLLNLCEQYVVTCPEDGGLELRGEIWKRLPPSLSLAEPQPDLSTKVKHDPLSILPFDILHTMLQNIPFQDSLSLMQASHHVCASTRGSTFWRSMIRTHLAPWFWEIRNLVDSDELPGLDYKGLFL